MGNVDLLTGTYFYEAHLFSSSNILHIVPELDDMLGKL